MEDKEKQSSKEKAPSKLPKNDDPYCRAENEDDDGYSPYCDRKPEPEPMFERDPWN